MPSDCSAPISRPIIKTLFPCNQPHLIVIKDIIPRPVDEHHQPISESDQSVNVEGNPDHPGDESAKGKSPDARHCRVPPDGREQARILVLERFGRFTFQDFLDVLRCELGLLLCDCRQHRQWLTMSILEIGRVADDKHFRTLRQL